MKHLTELKSTFTSQSQTPIDNPGWVLNITRNMIMLCLRSAEIGQLEGSYFTETVTNPFTGDVLVRKDELVTADCLDRIFRQNHTQVCVRYQVPDWNELMNITKRRKANQ